MNAVLTAEMQAQENVASFTIGPADSLDLPTTFLYSNTLGYHFS